MAQHHGHTHHHDHAHEGDGVHHGHHHGNPSDKAFPFAIALNTLFVVAEFSYGFLANSTALMADAGHNLSDVLGLLLAWAAVMLARKAPSERYTYGLRSSSILASLANAVLLFVACGAIGWEAVQRLLQPAPVAGNTVMVIAAIGIVINGLSAWLFMKGRKGDLNIRAAYWHMVGDAAVSAGVVIAGALILLTGWYWLDALMSLVIVVVIIYGTWGLLRESIHLALNAVPPHIDAEGIDRYLRGIEGVSDVHDLHIWGMSTTESALTAHLVMPEGHPGDIFADTIVHTLKTKFLIQHSTLQIEQGTTDHYCMLLTAAQ